MSKTNGLNARWKAHRQGSVEIVGSCIERYQLRQLLDSRWDRSGKLISAQVDIDKVGQEGNFPWNGSTEIKVVHIQRIEIPAVAPRARQSGKRA